MSTPENVPPRVVHERERLLMSLLPLFSLSALTGNSATLEHKKCHFHILLHLYSASKLMLVNLQMFAFFTAGRFAASKFFFQY